MGKPGSTDARDLLSAFDIGVCKGYYDGNTIHVHDPHLTFRSKSMVHEPRAKVIDAYLGFLQQNGTTDRWGNQILDAMPRDRGGPIRRQENGFGHVCTYEGPSDVCEAVSLELWAAAAIESPDSVPRDQRSLVGSKEYHNFICRMVHRLQKYAERGIEFVNCPGGALETKIYMEDTE